MHEMPYVKAALATVLATAGGRKVRRVSVQVGEGASDVTEFKELFFVLAEGTVAGNAKLEVFVMKPSFECHACAQSGSLDYSPVRCPKCGSPDIETNANEVKVVEIETD